MAFLLEDERERGLLGGAGSPLVLEYMKGLAPPAVDVELRALCTHAADEEGLQLLTAWVRWLAAAVASGDNFEVLQAYLHRTLTIYTELATQVPAVARGLAVLSAANSASADRFRGLIQKNLCLLKMMANIPIS